MKTITMTKKLSQIIGVALGTFIVLGSVHAQTNSTTLRQSGNSPTEIETLKFGGTTQKVATGAYQVTDSTNNQFWVYCLDPLTTLVNGASYTTTSLSSFVSNSYTALFSSSNYKNSGGYDAVSSTSTVLSKLEELYSHAYEDSKTSKEKSAAFQYAIWEIEGDTGKYKSNSGDLSFKNTNVDAGFATQVSLYLSALNNNTWGALNLSGVTNYIYTVYQSSALGKSQTVLSVVAQASSNKVPEPSTMLLLGIGMLALGASRRSAKASRG
jgi:hypothetical protein